MLGLHRDMEEKKPRAASEQRAGRTGHGADETRRGGPADEFEMRERGSMRGPRVSRGVSWSSTEILAS